MKNFNVNIIKQITAAAIPKKAARRLHKAKREYKDIKKLIYSAAKQGNSSIRYFFYTNPSINLF